MLKTILFDFIWL